jgi:hypothetical protein
MAAETSADQIPQPDIRKRRQVLYVATAIGVLLVAVFAARSLFSGDDKPKTAPKVITPVIIERIELKPVDGASGRGLAEVLRRGEAESLRVLTAKLKPSNDKQIYQLVLTGGTSDEKLLGNEAVGADGIFVGEAKVSIATLHQYKRIEIKRITNGAPPKETTVLRGSIPR